MFGVELVNYSSTVNVSIIPHAQNSVAKFDALAHHSEVVRYVHDLMIELTFVVHQNLHNAKIAYTRRAA